MWFLRFRRPVTHQAFGSGSSWLHHPPVRFNASSSVVAAAASPPAGRVELIERLRRERQQLMKIWAGASQLQVNTRPMKGKRGKTATGERLQQATVSVRINGFHVALAVGTGPTEEEATLTAVAEALTSDLQPTVGPTSRGAASGGSDMRQKVLNELKFLASGLCRTVRFSIALERPSPSTTASEEGGTLTSVGPTATPSQPDDANMSYRCSSVIRDDWASLGGNDDGSGGVSRAGSFTFLSDGYGATASKALYACARASVERMRELTTAMSVVEEDVVELRRWLRERQIGGFTTVPAFKPDAVCSTFDYLTLGLPFSPQSNGSVGGPAGSFRVDALMFSRMHGADSGLALHRQDEQWLLQLGSHSLNGGAIGGGGCDAFEGAPLDDGLEGALSSAAFSLGAETPTRRWWWEGTGVDESLALDTTSAGGVASPPIDAFSVEAVTWSDRGDAPASLPGTKPAADICAHVSVTDTQTNTEYYRAKGHNTTYAALRSCVLQAYKHETDAPAVRSILGSLQWILDMLCLRLSLDSEIGAVVAEPQNEELPLPRSYDELAVWSGNRNFNVNAAVVIFHGTQAGSIERGVCGVARYGRRDLSSAQSHSAYVTECRCLLEAIRALCERYPETAAACNISFSAVEGMYNGMVQLDVVAATKGTTSELSPYNVLGFCTYAHFGQYFGTDYAAQNGGAAASSSEEGRSGGGSDGTLHVSTVYVLHPLSGQRIDLGVGRHRMRGAAWRLACLNALKDNFPYQYESVKDREDFKKAATGSGNSAEDNGLANAAKFKGIPRVKRVAFMPTLFHVLKACVLEDYQGVGDVEVEVKQPTPSLWSASIVVRNDLEGTWTVLAQSKAPFSTKAAAKKMIINETCSKLFPEEFAAYQKLGRHDGSAELVGVAAIDGDAPVLAEDPFQLPDAKDFADQATSDVAAPVTSKEKEAARLSPETPSSTRRPLPALQPSVEDVLAVPRTFLGNLASTVVGQYLPAPPGVVIPPDVLTTIADALAAQDDGGKNNTSNNRTAVDFKAVAMKKALGSRFRLMLVETSVANLTQQLASRDTNVVCFDPFVFKQPYSSVRFPTTAVAEDAAVVMVPVTHRFEWQLQWLTYEGTSRLMYRMPIDEDTSLVDSARHFIERLLDDAYLRKSTAVFGASIPPPEPTVVSQLQLYYRNVNATHVRHWTSLVASTQATALRSMTDLSNYFFQSVFGAPLKIDTKMDAQDDMWVATAFLDSVAGSTTLTSTTTTTATTTTMVSPSFAFASSRAKNKKEAIRLVHALALCRHFGREIRMCSKHIQSLQFLADDVLQIGDSLATAFGGGATVPAGGGQTMFTTTTKSSSCCGIEERTLRLTFGPSLLSSADDCFELNLLRWFAANEDCSRAVVPVTCQCEGDTFECALFAVVARGQQPSKHTEVVRTQRREVLLDAVREAAVTALEMQFPEEWAAARPAADTS